jgi:hypothetical protein
MNRQEFKEALVQSRIESQLLADKNAQERAADEYQRQQVLENKLAESRQLICNAVASSQGSVRVPCLLPPNFIREMEDNHIWFSRPHDHWWSAYDDYGGGQGCGPATGATILSVSYNISLVRPPSPDIRY